MQRKRSKGVLIFGCLIILFAVFGIKGYLTGIQSFKTRGLSSITLQIAIFISFIEIILAINMLKLKEWARKSLILIAIITLALNLWSYKNAVTTIDIYWDQQRDKIAEKEMMEEARMRMEKQIEQTPPEQQESMRKIYENFKPKSFMKLMIIIVFGINIFWRLILIFFFTRLRVKEQFIKNETLNVG